MDVAFREFIARDVSSMRRAGQRNIGLIPLRIGYASSISAHRQIAWRRPARHKEDSVAKRGEHT